MNKNANQRWYDVDPTVSLAMSFIRNLSLDQQTEIAKRMIEKCKNLNIEVNDSRIVLNRRWYDENEDLSKAMEYLRQASPQNKKIVALDVIDFLTKIK